MFLDYINSFIFTAQLEWKDLSPLTIPSIPKHTPTERRHKSKNMKGLKHNHSRSKIKNHGHRTRKVKSKLKWKKMKLRRQQRKKQNVKSKDSIRSKKSKETTIKVHLDSREQTKRRSKANTNVYGRHIIE